MQREQLHNQLKNQFDLLIIGGGITGVGAARDAARRGLKVALIDMQDLAFGTSSRSSKLVHGGLRYLEQFEFSLVFEAVSERRILMNIAPHLVTPLGFLFPVYKSSRHNVWTINLGMWVYDGLSLFRSPKMHRNLSLKEIAIEEPALSDKGLKGAPLYYDCATDDARLTLENALDASEHGAVIGTYIKAKSFVRDQNQRITGVTVEDVLSGDAFDVASHTVINATGPWSDRTRNLEKSETTKSLRPTKGIHIVVDTNKLKINNAVVCFHPDDGRVLFAIPWGDRTYIGTTDTDYQEDPSDVAASSNDVDYLIEASNYYFSDNPLNRDDVISTWAGVRPLVAEESDGEDGSESSVSREHSIRIDGDGLITIAGGKLTTYRRMGAEVVEHAISKLKQFEQLPEKLADASTDVEPLPGAVGWPESGNVDDIARQILAVAGQSLAQDSATLLANTYGTKGIDIAHLVAEKRELAERLNSERPEILAQVEYALSKEIAYTVRDVLIRRTQIFFRDYDQGLGCCERVAEYMAQQLGWTSETKAHEIDMYKAEVERSRQWQVG